MEAAVKIHVLPLFKTMFQNPVSVLICLHDSLISVLLWKCFLCLILRRDLRSFHGNGQKVFR